jgi:hypothetical protein
MKKIVATTLLSGLLAAVTAYGVDPAPPVPPMPPAPPAQPAPATQPAAGRQNVLIFRTAGGGAPAAGFVRAGAVPYGNAAYQVAGQVPVQTEKAAWLGVSASHPPLALLKQLKIKNGLVVDEVMPDSPAAAAGVKPLDLIEKLDDQLLINPAQLEALVRMHKAGDGVKLTILHEGDRSTVTAKLVEHDVLVMPEARSVPMLEYGGAPVPLRLPGAPDVPMPENIGKDVKVLVSPATPEQVQLMTSNSSTSSDGQPSFESQYSDGKHQLTITRQGNEHILTITDASGKQVFQGPVDTLKQQEAIPKDILPKFREMQKMQNMTDDIAKPADGR